MAEKQGTLIYIDKDNITEAEFMSKSFINKDVKNRAYINALGAELVMKYIASEGIDIENIHNIHSISKILEKIDIADILLPNIHIDTRVVFNEDQIFIPKSHFDLEITPDIYVVVMLDKEFNHVEFLGYFKPNQIDKKNENKDYYFISKTKLSAPDTLTKFIKDFTGKTSRNISQEDILRGRELSVTLADHNITNEEFKELLELLLLNDSLRESVLEFDNFETLAYNVASELGRSNDQTLMTPLSEHEQEEDNNQELNTNNEEINLSEMTLGDDDILLDESFFDEGPTTEEDTVSSEPSIDTDTTEQETTDEAIISENISTEEQINSTLIEDDTLTDNITDFEDINNKLDEKSTDLGEDLLEDNTSTEETLGEMNLNDNFDISQEENSLPALNEEAIDLGEDLLEDNISTDETLGEMDLNDNFDISQEENSLPALNEEAIDLGEDLLEDNISTDETLGEMDLNDNFDISQEENSLPALNEEAIDLGEDLLEDNISTNETLGETDLTDNQNNSQEEDQLQSSKDIGSKSKNNLAETITNALKDSITGSAVAGSISASGAMAAGEKASEEAIKLASVAGDLVNDIVNKNIESQQKNLDKIDYAKTTTDATAVPEHISAIADDLAAAKLESTLKEEASGKFESPKDLSTLKHVENAHEEVAFEQETIELGNLETVKTEEFTEDTDSIVNLENLTNINSPTKPVDNLEEKMKEPEVEKMDLPNLSSFEINEDGTSTFDNFATDINFNNEEEHLVDLNMPSNEFKIDNNAPIDLGTTSDESDISFDNSIIESEETLLDDTPDILETTDDFTFDNTLSESDLTPDTELESSETIQNDIINTNENSIVEENPTPEDNTSPIENTLQSSTAEYSDVEDLSELLSDDDFSDEDTHNDSINNGNSDIQQSANDDISNLDQNASENSQDEQNWMDDTNYDNLQDVEIDHSQLQNAGNEISDEELITEPEENSNKTFAVIENSTVISDRTFTVGEIPIDINNPEMQPHTNPNANESLEELYDPNAKVPGSSLLQTPGRLGSSSGAANAGLGLGLKVVGGLIVLAIVCAIGFGVAKLFKTPKEEAPQPITDDAIPTSPDNGVTESANTLDVNPDNVVKMDNNTNALASTTQTPSAKTTQQTVQPKTQQTTTLSQAQKKSMAATTFLEVRKLTWEVPDYISYNAQFKQYFQAAGKSLKLSLTSDLLLATDYAYSNEIKVSITFDKDGTFKNAQIITSSGSTQIDSIVLQTVNQTLKVLKAPHSVGNDESTTAILKIYL